MRRLKIIDLFCGTGAFSKGFENSRKGNYLTVFGIDMLSASIETFKLNHKEAIAFCQDIRTLECEEVSRLLNLKPGEIDLVIGGPPCQGFSSIRPFRSTNLNDPRNDLFYQFAEYVDYFRPKALIIENVIGLVTHNNGDTIESMEEQFSRIGYVCDWKILNAAHFGIPQRRERLIFIGVQKGAKIQFPTPTHYCDAATIGFHKKQKMLLPKAPDLFNRQELRPALTTMDAISDLPKIRAGELAEEYDSRPFNAYQVERRKRSRKLALHESTKHTEKMLEIIKHSGPNIKSIPKHLITSGFTSCYSRLDANSPSVTITVNFIHPASNRCIHPTLDRALTPREGARLQSFDDDFIFYGNRSQIVKQIGNAVPPLLGQIIGEAMSEVLM